MAAELGVGAPNAAWAVSSGVWAGARPRCMPDVARSGRARCSTAAAYRRQVGWSGVADSRPARRSCGPAREM